MASVRKLPLVTIGLLIISYVVTYSTDFARSLPHWVGNQDTVLLFLHPFFHVSTGHIVFDTVLWLVAGTLAERWITFTRNKQIMMFITFYLSSLAAYGLANYIKPYPVEVLGLSGLISAAIPFLLFYLWFFQEEISTKKLTIAASFGVGMLFWFIIGPILNWTLSTNLSFGKLDNTSLFHSLTFICSLFPAFLLLRKQHRDRLQWQSKRIS